AHLVTSFLHQEAVYLACIIYAFTVLVSVRIEQVTSQPGINTEFIPPVVHINPQITVPGTRRKVDVSTDTLDAFFLGNYIDYTGRTFCVVFRRGAGDDLHIFYLVGRDHLQGILHIGSDDARRLPVNE